MNKVKGFRQQLKTMEQEAEDRRLEVQWYLAPRLGNLTTPNSTSTFAELSRLIVNLQIGEVERDDYQMLDQYRFSHEWLTMQNPLVHYLIEKLLATQNMSKMIIDAFGEYADEVYELIKMTSDAKQAKSRKIIFQGKEIS